MSRLTTMWTMRRVRGVSSVLALLCCAVLVLTACGANPPASPQEAVIPASNPYGGNPDEEGEPIRGGTLTLGMDREISGFDPVNQTTNPVAFAVYDSLMKFNNEGEPEPYLAESMETTDDGRTWRLRLRPDVRFHDGTPLNADAVIFNVQRHRDNESSPGYIYAQRIESMRAVDDRTVEFVLREQFGTFPSVFALPFSNFTGSLGVIASPTAIRRLGDEYERHPVGAGPYRFVEWIPDSRVVVERNDDYWQDGLPYLDRLEFRPLPDTESRYASVENGDVDLIYAGYHTELIRAADNPNLVVYYAPGSGAEWASFNRAQPPFDDRRMREAYVRAINPEALSATQFRGRMEPADNVFGPDHPYYSAEASRSFPRYDPERARQLIEDYRADGGNPNFTLKASNSPNRISYAEFVQAQLAEVGVDVRLEFYDLAQLSTTVILNRDYQMTTGLGGPWDNPFPMVYNQFHSQGNTNNGGYSNPEMDRVLDRAIGTTDEDERRRMYQRAQEIANQDIVAGWYSRAYLSTIAQPEVNGVVRYLSRDMFFATLWLDR